jgi:hypothetical protein
MVNTFPYLIQYPLSALPLLKFNFDVAILSTPFVYPAMIAAELFVIDRINAGRTFRIIFLPKDPGGRRCIIRVRNSEMMGFRIQYKLASDFEQHVFNKH